MSKHFTFILFFQIVCFASFCVAKENDSTTVLSHENGIGLIKGWKNAKESSEATLKICPLSDIKLQCDLDTFFSLFLSDDARHSIEKYQEGKIGDSELVTSPWEKVTKSNKFGGGALLRTIKYRHPVHAPMAPPTAHATKTQTLQRFGAHGLLMETITVVNDVPKTDCFIVEDRMLVEQNEEGGVTLSARFGIRFIKKTMFRPIIQRTTTAEFISWFKGFGEYVVDALSKDENRLKKITRKEPVTRGFAVRDVHDTFANSQ